MWLQPEWKQDARHINVFLKRPAWDEFSRDGVRGQRAEVNMRSGRDEFSRDEIDGVRCRRDQSEHEIWPGWVQPRWDGWGSWSPRPKWTWDLGRDEFIRDEMGSVVGETKVNVRLDRDEFRRERRPVVQSTTISLQSDYNRLQSTTIDYNLTTIWLQSVYIRVQSDYNLTTIEYNRLQADYNRLQSDYNLITIDYNRLQSTTIWLQSTTIWLQSTIIWL
jgi:hypothetical protein